MNDFHVLGEKPKDDESIRAVAFLREFRREGLKSSLYAAYAALSLVVLFMVFQELSNRFTLEALVIRVLMMLVLVIGILVILKREEFSVRYYPFVVGGVCLALFVGVILILYHPGIEAIGVGFGSMPAVMFGLFLMYGFLRLPMLAAIAIGGGFSALAVWVAGPEYSGAGKLRLLMYLCAMNILGSVLAKSIEKRERNLFDQRGLLEGARRESDHRANLAESAYAEKLRMIAAVNHDLRQPMIAASSHLGMLKRRLEAGNYKDSFEQIRRIDDSMSFLGETLDHLLTAARYESGTEPIRIEYFNLSNVIDQVRSSYLESALSRGLEIRLSFPRERIEILSDRASITRVLMNLVGNAIKFNRNLPISGLGVLIRVKFVNGLCLVDVVDTGIGIDLADQMRVWNPYVQLGNQVEDRKVGLGLGLFVVRAALQRLEGHSIRLRSRIGRGTRFTLSLPGRVVRGAGNSDLVLGPLNQEVLMRLAGAYVIVIEEDLEARMALTDVLADWGVVSSGVGKAEDLVLAEESSDRIVDTLIFGTRAGDLSKVLCGLQFARNHLMQEVVCAVIQRDSSCPETELNLPGKTSFLAIPIVSSVLADIILNGVNENKSAEQ